MNDIEVAAALAAQEEHIKRTLSCGGVVGRAHRYRPHGDPETKAQFSACLGCGVTETAADYEASGRGLAR